MDFVVVWVKSWIKLYKMYDPPVSKGESYADIGTCVIHQAVCSNGLLELSLKFSQSPC